MRVSTDPSDGRRSRAASLLAAVLLCLGLGAAGCSMPIGDMPQAMGGLPAGAPARPAEQAEFPAVHDMPPARRDTLLEPEEQQRIHRELQRARESQESRAASQK